MTWGEDFRAALIDLGLDAVRYRDATDEVLPSSKFLYVWATVYLPLGKLYHLLGRVSDGQPIDVC